MRRFLARFAASDSGVTAIEYALIASLIGMAIVAAVTNIGTSLQPTFTTVASALK